MAVSRGLESGIESAIPIPIRLPIRPMVSIGLKENQKIQVQDNLRSWEYPKEEVLNCAAGAQPVLLESEGPRLDFSQNFGWKQWRNEDLKQVTSKCSNSNNLVKWGRASKWPILELWLFSSKSSNTCYWPKWFFKYKNAPRNVHIYIYPLYILAYIVVCYIRIFAHIAHNQQEDTKKILQTMRCIDTHSGGMPVRSTPPLYHGNYYWYFCNRAVVLPCCRVIVAATTK